MLPASEAWVALHTDCLTSGAARPGGRRVMAFLYRKFAEQYPAWADLAHRLAWECEAEALAYDERQARLDAAWQDTACLDTAGPDPTG